MSWKPPRRTLQNVHKVKLAFGHPLPDNVEDANCANEALIVAGQKPVQRQRNDPFSIPDNYASLPDSSCGVEKSYFDKFEEIPEFDHGDDGDLDRILFSDFGDTGGSTWDDSSASFLSWTDEVEDAEAAKTKALFDEVEHIIYGEESSMKNDQLVNECLAWCESHISLRVVGKSAEFTSEEPSNSSLLEDSDCEEEIFASNSFTERPLALEGPVTNCGDGALTPRRAASGGLFEKVKRAALEQLTLFALQEAVKSFQIEGQSEHLALSQNTSLSSEKDTSSSASDISTNLNRALVVSGKSLHRTPSVLGTECVRKTHLPINSEFLDVFPQPRRFSSIINVIPEDRSTNVFKSVPGLPRPFNVDLPNAKPVESTKFLSSAGRRKAGLWNRRFSCFGTEHDGFVNPIGDNSDYVRNSSGSLRGNVNIKQMSVPNTPLKFLKHLSLPPIQNMNSYNKLSSNMLRNNQQSLTHIRRIFVKNKVSLSPLPIAVGASDNEVSDLQLAKSLLESTPDASRWSSCRKIGIPGSRNLRARKKSNDRNMDEM